MASSETITSENFGESSMIDNNRVMAEEARGNTFEQVKVILEGPILDRFKTESNKA